MVSSMPTSSQQPDGRPRARALGAPLQGFPGRSTLHRASDTFTIRCGAVASTIPCGADMSEHEDLAGRHDAKIVETTGSAPHPASPPRVLIFIAALIATTLTFGSSIALLARSAPRPEAVGEEGPRTAAPAHAVRAVATSARVAAAAGTSERLEAGTFRVTFKWSLEGARVGDPLVLRFFVGNRILTEQRGALDASVFSPATGMLTLPTTQECSTEGWSAELVTLRGASAVGETTSRVPGVTCP